MMNTSELACPGREAARNEVKALRFTPGCGSRPPDQKRSRPQQSRRPPTLVDGKQLAAVLRIKPLWRLHCCAACFLLRGRRTDPDPPELNKTKRKAPETVPRGYEGSEETRLASQPAHARRSSNARIRRRRPTRRSSQTSKPLPTSREWCP